MDLTGYLTALRRRWLSVIIVVLAVLAVSASVSLLTKPQYTATTRVFFAVQGGESVADLAQGSTFAEKQMTSYAEVATSPLVLTPVIDRLRLNTSVAELAEKITATVPLDTVILSIEVTDRSAALSADIANATGVQIAKTAASLSPERPDGSEAVRATILAAAQVPITASSPQVLRNIGLGAILGLLLGLGLALLRDALDTSVRTEQDVRAITERPILGAIGFDAGVPQHPLMILESPDSPGSEAIRRLRTNLQFIDVAERSKSLVITSSISGEGKTTTAMNLALSLADAGSRVVLVDADLRRPSVADYLGLEGGVGLTTVLIGKADVSDVVQPWRGSQLDILPSGQTPPNPSELLGSPAMLALHDQLTEHYDFVILDSPPLLPVTDAVVLSKIAGGALVVVGADRIHRAQLRAALASIATAGANLFGLVINKIEHRQADGYGYGYTSSYLRKEEPFKPGQEHTWAADQIVDARSASEQSQEGKRVLASRNGATG